jgi:hypothetical protein
MKQFISLKKGIAVQHRELFPSGRFPLPHRVDYRVTEKFSEKGDKSKKMTFFHL